MFLPILLYTVSVLIASLLFYYSYRVLLLFELPEDRLQKEQLRVIYKKILYYESVHLFLILLYLCSVCGSIMISLEPLSNMKLTVTQLGISFIIVLYPFIYMSRLSGKRKLYVEQLDKEKSRDLFEQSMLEVEKKFFGGERRERLREVFSDFIVFPLDQLNEYEKGLDNMGVDGKELLVHAWIKEKENQVLEYKQFYETSSFSL